MLHDQNGRDEEGYHHCNLERSIILLDKFSFYFFVSLCSDTNK